MCFYQESHLIKKPLKLSFRLNEKYIWKMHQRLEKKYASLDTCICSEDMSIVHLDCDKVDLIGL